MKFPGYKVHVMTLNKFLISSYSAVVVIYMTAERPRAKLYQGGLMAMVFSQEIFTKVLHVNMSCEKHEKPGEKHDEAVLHNIFLTYFPKIMQFVNNLK